MKTIIESGQCVLGIELGSTRIKAILTDTSNCPIAQGSHEWENQFQDGLWTYSLDAVEQGMRACFADLSHDVECRYGCRLTQLKGIGVSAMMHGYLAFDNQDHLLTPFRTWRNTNTGRAAKGLSEFLGFNFPLRWSLSHLYQCILDDEDHVGRICHLTTLAGYVHRRLTGMHVLGIGDASGMMPVDSNTLDYDDQRIRRFDELVANYHLGWSLRDILPVCLAAGEEAGRLTLEGALWLDPTGRLQPGAPLCPPEGDAGTGMVATNAVRPRTGNVSAGTSSFSMIVLDKPLSQPYEAIDIVTTPHGLPVAMVHCNTCTSDLNAWIELFRQYRQLIGQPADTASIYSELYQLALSGEPDCGGLVSYNFFAGEPVVNVLHGRPMLLREPTDHFSLPNLMRALLYAAIAPLKIGNDILLHHEQVAVERITAHGGLFKTPEVGQRILAAALDTPVSVMDTAGEGGAWGIALLASYAVNNPHHLSLPDWLDQTVFRGNQGLCLSPRPEDVAGFSSFIERYKNCLPH